jgi:hypothetical protein
VTVEGRGTLLEDAFSVEGFALYALDADPGALLDADTGAYLKGLGCALVRIDRALDSGHVYRDWFAAHACTVALVRPDFYVFGTADTAAQTRELVGRLKAALTNSATREESLAT